MKKFLALFLVISTVFCFSAASMCFAENVEEVAAVSESKDVEKVEVTNETEKSKFLDSLKNLKEKYKNNKKLQTATFSVLGFIYGALASYSQYKLIKAAVVSGIEEYNEKDSVISKLKDKASVAYDFIKSGVNDSLSYLDFSKII